MKKAKSIIHFCIASILSTFLILFVALPSLVSALDIKEVTVEGTASMKNISKQEGRGLAVKDATYNAVYKAVGLNLSAEALIVNLRLSGGIIGAIPYGRIIDKKIIEEGVEETIYRVKIKANVAKETTGIDPSFKLETSLNRSSYKDGDDMFIKIKPTKSCYVSVFTIFEDEKVLRLLPNRFKKDIFIKANQTYSFPDKDDIQKKIKLKVHLSKGKNVSTETIYVLALKQPFHYNAGEFREGIFGLYDGQTAFMNELIKEVVNIPLSERAEKIMPYQIKKN